MFSLAFFNFSKSTTTTSATMDNEKSKVIGQSGGVKETPVQTKGVTARLQRINVQRVQNVLLIWLDNNIDEKSTDCRNNINQLRRVVNGVNIFTDIDPCIDFLTDIYDQKVFVLISGSLCHNIIPLIHEITQLHTIFVLCANQTTHEQCKQSGCLC